MLSDEGEFSGGRPAGPLARGALHGVERRAGHCSDILVGGHGSGAASLEGSEMTAVSTDWVGPSVQPSCL